MPLVTVSAQSGQVNATWSLPVPPAHVWDGIASPKRLHLWLGELIEGKIAPGSTFAVDHGQGAICRSTVEIYEPGTELAYSWKFSDEPYSRLAWRIETEGTGSLLSMEHSGLGDLADSYRDGWLAHLIYLEGQLLNLPLPMPMLMTVASTITAASQGAASDQSSNDDGATR
ncbi:SRPBCC family protein [Flaviflexus huanghaiensis]|uniref:SRPBCC family protein n=1 Tax=Flaviflexus huanghaiensis TaxID=1111473 RepID=UPI0015FD5285|nr:SRPBCC domain-containing protein [Flaviflexus huanghaiensis]